MERFQGPINPCFFGEHLDVECLEVQGLTSTGSFKFEEEILEDNRMPFLQMLQSVEMESTSFLPLKDHQPSFQTLLRLQHLKKEQQLNQPWEEEEEEEEQEQGIIHHYDVINNINVMPCEMETQIQALKSENCVTHDNLNNCNLVVELHAVSPVKSEPNYKDVQYLQYPVLPSLECQKDQEQPSSDKQTRNPKSLPVSRERRKRKRTRPTKNKEEVETQRMTHIAVERNRRRQMNDHLNVLRSLMPTSYIQRGDQASIVGGAIDFVKELEQLLHSLEAQKRMRKLADQDTNPATSSSSSSSTAAMPSSSNGLFMSISQHRIGLEEDLNNNVGEEVRAENKSEAADVQVTVIQTHVNLQIQCPRRPGQLLKAIVALEDLRLSILHLNITSSQSTVLYSFNLKIEDGCKFVTADEIAGAVHQIFRSIDGS